MKDINKDYISYSFSAKILLENRKNTNDLSHISWDKLHIPRKWYFISLLGYDWNKFTVDYFRKNIFILGVEDKSIVLIPLQGFAKVTC